MSFKLPLLFYFWIISQNHCNCRQDRFLGNKNISKDNTTDKGPSFLDELSGDKKSPIINKDVESKDNLAESSISKAGFSKGKLSNQRGLGENAGTDDEGSGKEEHLLVSPSMVAPVAANNFTDLPFNLSCMNNLVKYVPQTTLLNKIIVSTLVGCWKYCKLTTKCTLFSYRFTMRKCTLHSRNATIVHSAEPNIDLAVGNMTCLECLQTDGEALELSSKRGVIIKDTVSGECLAVKWSSGTDYDRKAKSSMILNKNYAVPLTWKMCSKADAWILDPKKKGDSKTFVGGITTILLKANEELGLSTKIEPDGIRKAHLFNMTSESSIFLRRGLVAVDKQVCSYFSIEEISGRAFWPIFSLKGEGNLALSSVVFIEPISPDDKCSLRKLSVQNGVVLNEDLVPFFLAATKTIVRCNEGFGVASLNFSIYQEVECRKGVEPLPCTDVASHFKSSWTTSWCISSLLFACLIAALIYLIHKLTCSRHDDKDKLAAVMEQDQEEAGAPIQEENLKDS